jgi:hypothetical protein
MGGYGGWQNLHRDVAFDARISCAVDLAHAARTQQRQNLIRSEASAGRECHEGFKIAGLYAASAFRR